MEIDLNTSNQVVAAARPSNVPAATLSIDTALEPSARENEILNALRTRMNSEPLSTPRPETEVSEKTEVTVIVSAQKGKALQRQLKDIKTQLDRAEKVSKHLSLADCYKPTIFGNNSWGFVYFGTISVCFALIPDAREMLPVPALGALVYGAIWAHSSGLIDRIFHTPKAEAAALSTKWQDETLSHEVRNEIRDTIIAAQRNRVESLKSVYERLSREALGVPAIVKLKSAITPESVLRKISSGSLLRSDIVEALGAIEQNFDQMVEGCPLKTDAYSQGAREIVEDLGQVLSNHSGNSDRQRALHEVIETLGAALELS